MPAGQSVSVVELLHCPQSSPDSSSNSSSCLLLISDLREKRVYEMEEGEGEDPERAEMTAGNNAFMECSIYQNYTASEVMVQGLAGVVNQGDVEEMVRAQKEMLQRFEKTNEMLTNVNSLSAVRLEKVRISVMIMIMIMIMIKL